MTEAEFEELLTHLDALVAEFEEHPDPAVSARALELIRHVDAVHREGLGRIVGLIGRRVPELLEEAARDPVARILLALYDLAPAGRKSAAFVPIADLERSAAAARARGQRDS
jgi:hypothetical protein